MINPGVTLIVDPFMALIIVPLVFIALIDVRLLLVPALFARRLCFALRRYIGSSTRSRARSAEGSAR